MVGLLNLVADNKMYVVVVFKSVARNIIALRADWRAPALGWVKVNTNAAIMAAVGVGLGVVVPERLVLCWLFPCKGQARWMPELAEIATAMYGMLRAQQKGYKILSLDVVHLQW